MADVTQGISRGVRKPRKSRGRGLRATTGCLICKRRHVKCDEVRPQCGPCAKGQRACLYGNDSEVNHATNEVIVTAPPEISPPHIHEPLRALVDACHQENQVQQHRQSLPVSTDYRNTTLAPTTAPFRHGHIPSPVSPHEFVHSPGTDSSVSTRLAPLSWFELLANDAANADREFHLHRPRRDSSVVTSESQTLSLQSPVLQPRNRRERESFQAASFQNNPGFADKPISTSVGGPTHNIRDNSSLWNTSTPIQLSDQECFIFNHFVHTISSWMDCFDPLKHFSTIVPHLAMRNVGLMKALLSLSARHLSFSNGLSDSNSATSDPYKSSTTDQREGGRISTGSINRNMAVQYYYETLHYLNNAMRYQSYALSGELIVTAILISTYEMIDGSNQDWERHLKGVFWIQRNQDNDGESGGIRQAVWWVWLRQDLWAAMRERRRIFSFWRPLKPVSTLTTPELANRAFYLLGQCINYASREESESTDMQHRLERGNGLLYMLQDWHDHLPREFNSLPTPQTHEIFPPIWIHPPSHAAAVQAHSLARILVILHRPSIGGLQDYRAGQKLLTGSVNTICGIARMVDQDDTAASLLSLQCLFGAGMSVHSPHERVELFDLIEKSQRNICWPTSSVRKDLEFEYQKDEFSYFAK